MKAKRKPFDAAALDAKRARYDTAQGYGHTSQWRHTFEQVMGVDEALAYLDDRSPYAVLGLSRDATTADITRAFRVLARRYHPDRITETGYTEAFARAHFQEVQAAYVVLGGGQ